MLTIEEAQQTILNGITLLESEEVPLLHGLNRVSPDQLSSKRWDRRVFSGHKSLRY